MIKQDIVNWIEGVNSTNPLHIEKCAGRLVEVADAVGHVSVKDMLDNYVEYKLAETAFTEATSTDYLDVIAKRKKYKKTLDDIAERILSIMLELAGNTGNTNTNTLNIIRNVS